VPIELVNVTFLGDEKNDRGDEGDSPDRLAAITAVGELQVLFPSREWRLVHVDVSSDRRTECEKRIIGLIQVMHIFDKYSISSVSVTHYLHIAPKHSHGLKYWHRFLVCL
jgi:hypothetical protein